MTTFSEQFPIVFQALNVGFVQTLKLFFITLIGAIPLGLIISFGSMSAWRPFRVFRSVKWLSEFKPVRAITRLVIWVSPDGKQIAWMEEVDGYRQLWVTQTGR